MPEELRKILEELERKNIQDTQKIINFLKTKIETLSGKDLPDQNASSERCNVINTINYAIKQLEEKQEQKIEEPKIPEPPKPEPSQPAPISFPPYHFYDGVISGEENEQNNNELDYDYYDGYDSVPDHVSTKKEIEETERKVEEWKKSRNLPGNTPSEQPRSNSAPSNTPAKEIKKKKEKPREERKDSDYNIDDSESIDAGEWAEPDNNFPEQKENRQESSKKPEEKKPEKPEEPNPLQKVKNAFNEYERLKCYGLIQEIDVNFCMSESNFTKTILSKPKLPFSKDFC